MHQNLHSLSTSNELGTFGTPHPTLKKVKKKDMTSQQEEQSKTEWDQKSRVTQNISVSNNEIISGNPKEVLNLE